MERMTIEEQEEAKVEVRKIDIMMLRFAGVALGLGALYTIWWHEWLL